jgi:hypothetical protein
VTRSRPSRSRTGVRGGGGRSGETHGLNRIRHTRARDLITTRGAASVASAPGEVSVCPPYHRNHTCGYTRVKEVATRPRIAAPNERGRPPARRRRSVCRARFRGRSAGEETRPKRVEKAATDQHARAAPASPTGNRAQRHVRFHAPGPARSSDPDGPRRSRSHSSQQIVRVGRPRAQGSGTLDLSCRHGAVGEKRLRLHGTRAVSHSRAAYSAVRSRGHRQQQQECSLLGARQLTQRMRAGKTGWLRSLSCSRAVCRVRPLPCSSSSSGSQRVSRACPTG